MKIRFWAAAGVAALALTAPVAAIAGPGGNSNAAHACQKDGYKSLYRADATGFKNAGDCVSYAAKGDTLHRKGSLTDTQLSACNELSYGYTIDGVNTAVGGKAYGCETGPAADATFVYPMGSTVGVYLTDVSCGGTYASDGDHARVTGTNPYRVDIADAGGFCEGLNSPRPPGDFGNLSTTLSL